MAEKRTLDDVFELADLLRPEWDEISAAIPAWHPRAEGDPEPDPEPDPDTEPDPEPEPIKPDDDWQAKARKHERDLKKERKTREALEAKLAERDQENQSEQEKALEQARKEATEAAQSEAQKERRADRLEVAVTRLAAKGVKVGSGEDAKVVKFSDPEDALVFIERELDKGDLDPDDVFDGEGKVQTETLQGALVDLLGRKPNLAENGGGSVPAGDGDGGKGSSAPTLEEIKRLAREDPAEFNRRFEAGELPASALGGK